MPGEAPGPWGTDLHLPAVDEGTSALMCMLGPSDADDGYRQFEAAIQALEADLLANVGVHVTWDAKLRIEYGDRIRAMSQQLEQQVRKGRFTWREAALKAHDTRNLILDQTRGRSMPVGLAVAQRLKAEGRTLNELIARKTLQLFPQQAEFNALTNGQRNQVYAALVKSAGKSDPKVNLAMSKLSRLGRGLLVFSVALSIHQVATADDKLDAASRELGVSVAGVAGGAAGGALAGLACGPGAPVCVAVGAFVGGAMAAFGVDMLW